MQTTLFGKPMGMPLAIAPTGAAGLCWYEGELELAKAAAAAKIPFTLATGAMTSMEKIAKEAGGRLWMQLYLWNDRKLSYELVRARRARRVRGADPDGRHRSSRRTANTTRATASTCPSIRRRAR